MQISNYKDAMRSSLYAMVFVVASVGLSGCVSMTDINDGYYRIGKAWQLDNQREADDYRYRVIESDYLSAFNATKKTFLALGMPVESSAIEKGILTAENIAPAPLTLEEWMEVKRIETPRLQELGGKLFSFPDNPKNFTITVSARLKDLGRGKVILTVDYIMASQSYKSMGMAVTPHAPPTAVKLGMLKFWRQLEIELKNANAPPPRKRAWNEEARFDQSDSQQVSQLLRPLIYLRC